MPTVILFEVDQLDDELASRAPAPGLLPLAGLPLVAYAARAFRACADVDKIVLCGPTAYQQHTSALAEVDETVLLDGSLGERVEAVLNQYGSEPELMFWPANGPCLTSAMVEHFLSHAPVDSALTWSLVRADKVKAAFPETQPVAQHAFGADTLSFGSLGLVRPAAIEPQRPLLQRVLGHEFSRGEMVKLLGVGFAIKFQAGRASLDELVRRIGEALSLPCVAIISPYPDLTFRVRSREDHHTARARLEAV